MYKTLQNLNDSEAVFQSLKEIDWSFSDDNTKYLSHDIHPYPAKFIPQLPYNLISVLSLKGELVWDPFGGSGTTALEAILCGRNSISTDLNPLSKIIGRAKTLTLTMEDEKELVDLLENIVLLKNDKKLCADEISRLSDKLTHYIPQIPNMGKWFHKIAIEELSYILYCIKLLNNKRAKNLALAAFSKSIFRSSFQDEETRYASKPRDVGRGDVLGYFEYNLDSAIKKTRELGHVLQFREAKFKTLDLREPLCQNIVADNSVDLIVTSPPYPNTTDYHLYHRFRLFWLNFNPVTFGHHEIGSHLRHQKIKAGMELYIEEMSQSMTNMFNALRPGRYATLVLGDGVFDKVNYETAKLVGDAATILGFEMVGIIDRPLHATKRSFNSASRRLRKEQILILRKPVSTIQLHLLPPPYKLRDYEHVLSQREIKSVMGKEPVVSNDGGYSVEVSSLDIDKARRLSFTHGFESNEIHRDSTWQAIIENGDAFSVESKKKEPKYATHGIHAYKGKFYPQLAKSLFNMANLLPGQHVLDPFCGSGTVLLESYLNGLTATGIELNPIAAKISKVKTSILDIEPYMRDRLLSKFENNLSNYQHQKSLMEVFPEKVSDELNSWFAKPVLSKMAWLLREANKVPEPSVRELLEVLVSGLVRDVSQQDPKDLRIRRRKTALDDAQVIEIFQTRLSNIRQRLLHFSERSSRAIVDFQPCTVIGGDSRDSQLYDPLVGQIDAIVTSPPYGTALPYIDTDRLSILLIESIGQKGRQSLESALVGSREIAKASRNDIDALIEQKAYNNIPSQTAIRTIEEIYSINKTADVGFRKKNMAALLYKYYEDMNAVMTQADRSLRNRGTAFFVIGDNKTVAGNGIEKTSREVLIRNGLALQEIGESLGWNVTDVIPISVTTENRNHIKNSIKENEIICFRKP